MIRFLAAIALITVTAPSAVIAQVEPAPVVSGTTSPIAFATRALNDAELSEQRGGFALPGGVDLALAVRIQTDVNSQPLLQTVLTINSAGASASTRAADGTVTMLDPRGGTALASLPGLSIEHAVGQRVGSIILNSGDDRVIDHQVSVNLSLGNVQVMTIGTVIFRVQALGIDAGILRSVGG